MPFVGRTRELADLRGEFDAARSGAGRVVVVSGDPGVGKTRLLQEFGRTLRGRALVLTGRGSPLGVTVPYGIVLEPLEAHLSQPLTEVSAASLRRSLTALAQQRPLVVILDDLHLADQSSCELVAYLGRQPPKAAVLVIAACRSARLTEAGALSATVGTLLHDHLASSIRLGALGPDEVSALAEQALGGPPAPDVLRGVLDRAGGNALLTVALLEQADPSAIPESIRERVVRIRADLPPDVRQTLDLAAVLGHSFSARTIASLHGTPETLDRLVSERLLAERPDGYDFAHPLVQEAVYDVLGAARRRELHDAVGRALTTAPLAVRAYHVARGALPGDAAAVELLRTAARETRAHREALSHLSAALDLTADPVVRLAVLSDIAGQAALVPDYVTGLAALAELLERETDPVRRAQLKMQQASLLSTGAADVAGADAAATEAVELLRDADAVEHLAAALNERAWIRGMAGDFRGQLDGCRSSLALAPDAGSEMRVIGPLGGVLGLLGDFDAAREAHRRGRDLAGRSGDPAQIGWHAAVASLTELYAGRFADAAAVLDPAVDPAPGAADIGTPWRTLTDWFLGRWQLGASDSAVVREAFPVTPPAHMAWSFTMCALFATATGGRPALTTTSRALISQADRAYGDRELYFFTALHHWAAGTVHWLTGDLTAARVHLRRSAERLSATEAVGFEGLLFAERADACYASGDIRELEACVVRAQEIADLLGTQFAAAQAAYAAGLLDAASRRTPAAVEAFTEALTGYADAPFLRARTLHHRAELSADHAVEDLREAARLYSRLPAPALRDRALTQLRAVGATGRRAAQQVGALTDREHQIATLASQGLSTPDIANRLSLSNRTVETHLGRIYHKLGIDRRTQLAEALGR